MSERERQPDLGLIARQQRQNLRAGYAAMAADEACEREAMAWSEGTIADVADEPRWVR